MESQFYCKECGKPVTDSISEGMEKHQECFDCNHWMDIIRLASSPEGKHMVACVAGCLYVLGPESQEGGMRGMGGILFAISFTDDNVTLTTTNLWSVGNIPEQFAPRLPDNAVFVGENKEYV